MRTLLVLAALAAMADEPPARGDGQALEDARQRDVLLRLNRERIARLMEGLAIVDQTERRCTEPWAAELQGVRDRWKLRSDELTHELLHPGERWVMPPREEVSHGAYLEMGPELVAAEEAFMERVRLINGLKTHCPEHDKALQGVYALGKLGFLLQ